MNIPIRIINLILICKPTSLDNVEWCCNIVRNYEDFVPGITWGSFGDKKTRNTWENKNCNDLVGGSEKSNCLGKLIYVVDTNFIRSILKGLYIYININISIYLV